MSTEKNKAVSAYVVKFPIGLKLALIIGFIVLIFLGSITFLNSHFVGEDVVSDGRTAALGSKLNEQPIATITLKYKTAQRKFMDRVVWDRLRQDSPVYNGDTIHTATLSEANIWFNDGNVMELMENKTSYGIDFLKLYEQDKNTFSKGTFKWTVHAIRRIDTNKDGQMDKILREGSASESTFSTDVPTPKKSKMKGAKNPYGN